VDNPKADACLRRHDGVGFMQQVYLLSLKEWIKICLFYTLKNVGLGLIIKIKI
jgi:hypothetical protein